MLLPVRQTHQPAVGGWLASLRPRLTPVNRVHGQPPARSCTAAPPARLLN